MITIINAQIYSINNGTEFAHEIEYSEGTKVRAVVSKDKFIRTERNDKGVWKATCKPYVVVKNKKRNAEKIVDAVNDFLV